MSKKYYKAFAKLVNSLEIEYADRMDIAKKMAKIFAENNPNFDENRFITACSPDVDFFPPLGS